MGCLKEEDKARIKDILVKAAEEEANIIIEYTEGLCATMPEDEKAQKDWADKQARAFADARISMVKQFTTEASKFR